MRHDLLEQGFLLICPVGARKELIYSVPGMSAVAGPQFIHHHHETRGLRGGLTVIFKRRRVFGIKNAGWYRNRYGVLQLEKEFGEPFREGVGRSQLYFLAEMKSEDPVGSFVGDCSLPGYLLLHHEHALAPGVAKGIDRIWGR